MLQYLDYDSIAYSRVSSLNSKFELHMPCSLCAAIVLSPSFTGESETSVAFDVQSE